MNPVKSSIRGFATLALLALALTACDSGGPSTQTNPNLTTTVGGYTGPAARTSDVLSFQNNFWQYLKAENRCGQCHGAGTSPEFVNPDNVNDAYLRAVPYVDLQSPEDSIFVTKVGGGHNCWESVTDACAASITSMIENWADDSDVTSKRLIQLTAPESIRDPGDAKSFPASAFDAGNNGSSFANTVHDLLIGASIPGTDNCQNCHEEIATPLPQAPFFASGDIESAYEAAKSKMNIDAPETSRFVARLIEGHNCWSECGDLEDAVTTDDVDRMLQAIETFAEGIEPTEVDPDSLLASKAMILLGDGIVASGGDRHESNQVALWEFKTGQGSEAFDTSGIEPAMNLTLDGSVEWLPGYGLKFTGGRAFANGITSDKLNEFIQSSGQFAIEAWVIPTNVTQEDANIVSYSGSTVSRNFTLGQDMYNYEFYTRLDDGVNAIDANGEPFLTTGSSGDELAQASLQHVVANYHPIDGRTIYVNGELVATVEPVPGPTTINNLWDDSFPFQLGSEAGNGLQWMGSVRMVSVHNRVLTQEQVTQNFEVGVGEKYFLLFSIAHRIGIPDSYIVFEVSQFDSYSYLFSRPTFVNLDPDWVPESVTIAGMRIGINGREALAGQAFANLNVSVDPAAYDPATGYRLSDLGTIIGLEKGAASDEFFLTFESIGSANGSGSRTFADIDPTVPADPPDPVEAVASDVGMRTFEEIHSTIAAMTGVPTTNAVVDALYQDYRQQLPSVEAIDAFLPSHQMAIAQLALTSCSELVECTATGANLCSITRGDFFTGFNFGAGAATAFDDSTKRAQVIDPLLTVAMNVNSVPLDNLTSQPDETDIHDLLGSFANQDLDAGLTGDSYQSLITEMLANDSTNSTARTAQIVKAVCGATVASAVMLVQ